MTTVSLLSPEDAKTLRVVARYLRDLARDIRECHTVGKDWKDHVEAKDEYHAVLAHARELMRIARQR